MTRVYPPPAAQRIAREALEVRASLPESRQAGLTRGEARSLGITSGVERAKSIAAGEWQDDPGDIRRFFSRFSGQVSRARAQGKDMRSSKAIQAWNLWGGDPMREAVR